MKVLKYKDGYLAITVLSKNALRIRASKQNDFIEKNPSVRYDIYNMQDMPDMRCEVNIELNEDILLINNKKVDIRFDRGFSFDMHVNDDERFYGLGDADRSTLEKRGTEHTIWVKNVKCYIPFPMILSSQGYGVFSSTTYKQHFDICKSNEDVLSVSSEKGYCDMVVFTGNGFGGLLREFRNITGQAKMLPRFAYGLSFVANQKIDSFNMINEMYTFRKEEIPCDVYGLEPEWMEKRYDSSVDKKFNPNKFYIPYWVGPERIRDLTFFKPIRTMNFKLSLWLCCDYDLSYEEERGVLERQKKLSIADKANDKQEEDTNYLKDRVEIDQRLQDAVYLDKLTKPEQAWFEHLKKFVDMGAKVFKLDGAWQINEHPDRVYGNGMLDDEMHNLYSLLYAKQMSNGYEDHTNTRSLIYSSGGFAGVQQYVATWAGDTGGGPKPLLSMLNLAMSGHVNTTCDMSIYDKEGIHFGFLQPWSQQANWDFWNQPWLFEKDLKDCYKYYSQLRYSLIPYIYSAAYEAYLNMTPIMRPLVYDYPNDEKVFNIPNQYMLGSFLMVGAFLEDKLYLPEGIWIDYFTREKYEGGRYIEYEAPEGKGGALFIKEGAMLPRSYGLQYISDEAFSSHVIEVYPSTKQTSFTLYDDDGISLDYKQQAFTKTKLAVIQKDNDIYVSISAREGDFVGKPDDIAYEIRLMGITQCDNFNIYLNSVKQEVLFNVDKEDVTKNYCVIKSTEKELIK